mmetsp:Transcript_10941/g.27100  ORF Transcript_10941/g.27100 Transcript_10941/m.27100 type:complete len:301 (+) Transcript_10941:34-936(+)
MKQAKITLGILEITNCSFSPNGKIIGCTSSDGNLVILNSRFPQKIYKKYKIHKDKINRFFFGFRNFFTASSDKTCGIWNTEIVKKIRNLDLVTGEGIEMDCIEHEVITTTNLGSVGFWDQRILHPLFWINHGFPLLNAKFFKNSEKIITSGVSSEIFLWDLRNFQKPFSFFSLKEKTNFISSSCFSKDFLNFFCLNNNQTISKWSFNFFNRNLKLKNRTFLEGEPLLINLKPQKISCDTSGNFFAFGNLNGTVFVNFQKNCKNFRKFKIHTHEISEVNFHPTNRIICSCGNDGKLIINEL